MNERAPREMLNAIHDFIRGTPAEVCNLTPEEVRAEIHSRGINAADLKAKVSREIAHARGLRQLQAAKLRGKEFAERLAGLRAKITSPLGLDRGRLVAQLERLLGGSETATMYCRRFREAPTEDLASILDEIAMLDQLGDSDEADQPR